MLTLVLLQALLMVQQPGTAALVANSAPSDPAAVALTRRMLARETADGRAMDDYTFLITHEDWNYIKGKQTDHHTRTSEQISIAGLPYIRRLTRDGKPLEGKDLARENELYEKAVAERKGLSEAQRTALVKAKSRSVTFLPVDKLFTDYHLGIDGRETVGGNVGTVLTLEPSRADLPAPEQRRARWVIDDEGRVLRFHVEFLATDNGFGQGTTFDTENVLLDGKALPRTRRLDTTVRVSFMLIGRDVHDVATDEYTNYRRFRSSATILPDTVDQGPDTP